MFESPLSRLVPAGLGVALLASAAVAQEGNVTLPRHPSISPDGSTVVFSWRGDLWSVGTDGGRAMRLTSHPADETRSTWSPDGERIAFNSNRDGYNNIWTMRADGTDLQRVTDLDATATITDWAEVDGEEMILFSGRLDSDVYRDGRPYKVSPDGGPIHHVHGAFGVHPVASPDGERIMFARAGYFDGWERRHYRGAENQDVWIADAAGEDFTRLTEWEGNDGKARWMDDDTVLYLSDRADRSVNLYRRNVGQPETRARKLTDFDGTDIHDWDLSADGSTAVLMSWQDLYVMDMSARRPSAKKIAITAIDDVRDRQTFVAVGRNVSDAALSPDGTMMAMVAYGEVFVREMGADGEARRVTKTHAREGDVVWSPDGLHLYFTSDRDGTDSIYAASVARTRGEVKDAFDRMTGRTVEEDEADDAEGDGDAGGDGDGENAAADADPITGTWSGRVDAPGVGPLDFTMELEGGPDGLVRGTLQTDVASASITGTYNSDTGAISLTFDVDGGMQASFTGTVRNGSLDGTMDFGGEEVPFAANRTAAPDAASDDDDNDASDGDDTAKDDDAKDEDDPALDPKRWRDAIEFTIEPVVKRLSNDRGAAPSPDGKHLLFRGIRGNLHIKDLATGEVSNLTEHWDAGSSGVWSPCSRYIAVTQSDLDFNRDIHIHAVDGSFEPINITRHPDNDGSPSWSADSKLLAFVSERVNEQFDVWMVPLAREFESLAGPDRDAYFERLGKLAKGRKPLKPSAGNDDDADDDAKDDEKNADADEADAPFTVEDLESAYLRLRRITRIEGNESQALLMPGGDKIVFSASGLASGLHSVNWDGSGRTALGGGGRIIGSNLNGSKVVVVSGGQAQTMPPKAGGRETASFSDRILVDLNEQSSQKFLEAARGLGEGFYHPTMHGVNWSRLTREYHDLARGATTASEFNWVANRFIGELNASHMGIRSPSDVATPLREPRGRLGATYTPVDGGFEVVSIMPESPASKGPMALAIGDVITSVDGRDFGPTDTVASLLRGRVGDETVIGVRRTMEIDGDEQTMDLELLMVPTSGGAINGLAYRAWVQRNKDLVHEWSDGRLGYIHMQGMNQPSLDIFERDLFAAADGRDGLLLDVRNNGGGWTTDRVLSSIMVQSHSYTVPRGADWEVKGHYPQDRLFIQRYGMPMNLLCNEKSYSNAEIISHAFKTFNRGTLVGMPTHGSVISTGGFGLIDGTSVRLPFRGWFVDDGTDRDMELNGAVPDLIVPQTPEAEVAGDDEQLRAAVTDLLERMDDD
ncbi:MAG: S41 family peptidase [Phycisphaerales bacterium]